MTAPTVSASFEEIYALEQIDPRTIKPMHSGAKESALLWTNLNDSALKRWVCQRSGLVSKEECLEWLSANGLSQDTQSLSSLFAWDKHQYALSEQLGKKAQKVVESATSYFYTRRLCYSLKRLVSWIEREEARRWEGFPERFVKEVLIRSNFFIVRKLDHDNLSILMK